MTNGGGNAGNSGPQGISPWTIALAALLVAATLVTFVVGIALSSDGGQTPKESYILTVLLTVLSVAAGWIITLMMQQYQQSEKDAQKQNKQALVEQSARSAATRIFRSLSGLGRLQELTRDRSGTPAELKTQMAIAEELARSIFKNTEDSITDWERFAPEAVEDEISKVRQAAGTNNDGGTGA